MSEMRGHDAEISGHDAPKYARAQGMRNPLPRIQMLDGFNEGWIEFENPNKVRKGTVPLDAVLRELVARPLS